jgi:hypothetical protein
MALVKDPSHHAVAWSTASPTGNLNDVCFVVHPDHSCVRVAKRLVKVLVVVCGTSVVSVDEG